MKNFFRGIQFIALLGLSFAAFACSNNSADPTVAPQAPADTTAPYVTSKTPDDNGILSLGLSKQDEKTIQVVFSEPVILSNASSIKLTTKESRLTPVDPAANTQVLMMQIPVMVDVDVPAEITLDSNDQKTLYIKATVSDDTTYSVSLGSDCVRDNSGNPNAAVTWSFKANDAIVNPDSVVNPNAINAM